MTTGTALRAQSVLEELQKCGITHVVWLPHNESASMYWAVAQSPNLRLVQVCREGEAIAVALGLRIGGKEPVVMIQNTGFFESGDSVRGLALSLKMPLLLMIGYRGWSPDAPPTDSAGIYLEPLLKAWGINYHLVTDDADAARISQAYREAQETQRPVAVLVAD